MWSVVYTGPCCLHA